MFLLVLRFYKSIKRIKCETANSSPETLETWFSCLVGLQQEETEKEGSAGKINNLDETKNGCCVEDGHPGGGNR